jgi:asparagine synthase (glutamine-hydrolysing)
MCGLAGFARFGGDWPGDPEELLRSMAAALAHRGPDATRILNAGTAGLSFTRLSIVDPAGGDQPLSDPAGEVFLIANGEIYNHRELEATLPGGTRMRTQSDCEVLVHLYRRDGLRFLDGVRGIYAVVIWDEARGRLILARDRFGIKPLYFTRNADRILFASEIKALFTDPATPRSFDWEACLADQMMSSAPALDAGPVATWFSGIESVPAGAVVEIEAPSGATRTHQYWSLPVPGQGKPMPAGDIAAAYGDLLRASVQESSMSDAEVGLFLSGGIDSAAIAALSPPELNLRTFTALNGGTLVNGDGEYSHRIAATLGLPNHQVIFDAGRVPDAQEWKQLLWLLETPLCGPEQFYKYELHRYAKLLRPGLKVMLLGQASDEFNGGYTEELSGGGDWEDFSANLAAMARRRAFYGQPRLAAWWDQAAPLLADSMLWRRDPSLADPYAAFVAWKYRHIQQYNCWHEDRTAAGNGIEARVPFLDHRIVELTAAVPVASRMELLWDKRLLRQALAGVLPPEILQRPKTAFYFGAGERHVHKTFIKMLCADGGALLEEALASPRARDYLDAGRMRASLASLARDPAAGRVEFLLRLVNLGLIDQMVRESQPPLAGRPARPAPTEIVIGDWDGERPKLEARVLARGPLPVTTVPALADGVLLLHARHDEDLWYLAVDGSLEYVLSESDDDSGWLAMLRAMDGQRPLSAILAGAGASYPDVHDLLWEAIEMGLLTTAQAAAAGNGVAHGAGVQGAAGLWAQG